MSATHAAAAPSGTQGSWLFSLDHRRIGVLYLWVSCFAILVAAFLGWLTAVETAYPGQTFVGEQDLHLLGAGRGLFLVFFFLLPAIPAGLGNFILPLQVGAENVFHPSMNRLALHTFLLGLLAAVVAALLGGADAWWAPLTPYDLGPGAVVTWSMAAAALVVFSMMMTSLNFIGTVHLRRAPGMSLSRLPVSVWAIYIYSWVHIVAAPAATLAYGAMLMSRGKEMPFTNPETGFAFSQIEMLFWFFAAPVLLATILPVIGVVTEVLSAQTRRRPAAPGLLVYAMAAIGVMSFMVWGRELFSIGAHERLAIVGSVASFLVYALVLTIIFAWIGTLSQRGSGFQVDAALLYAVFAIAFLAIGALAGCFTASMALGPYLGPSLFASGRFELLVVSPVVMGLLAGLHYWWPKLRGCSCRGTAASLGAWAVFLGLLLSGLGKLALGIMGVPARAYSAGGPHLAAYLAELGATLVLCGLFVVVTVLARAEKGSDEGIEGAGLEWQAGSFNDAENFSTVPDGHIDPYDFR